MTWLRRAEQMFDLVKALDAPPDVRLAASDALQHFIWAQDCRRQCYAGGGAHWRAKANTAHGKGLRAIKKVQAWVTERPSKSET